MAKFDLCRIEHGAHQRAHDLVLPSELYDFLESAQVFDACWKVRHGKRESIRRGTGEATTELDVLELNLQGVFGIEASVGRKEEVIAGYLENAAQDEFFVSSMFDDKNVA